MRRALQVAAALAAIWVACRQWRRAGSPKGISTCSTGAALYRRSGRRGMAEHRALRRQRLARMQPGLSILHQPGLAAGCFARLRPPIRQRRRSRHRSRLRGGGHCRVVAGQWWLRVQRRASRLNGIATVRGRLDTPSTISCLRDGRPGAHTFHRRHRRPTSPSSPPGRRRWLARVWNMPSPTT